MDIGISYLPCKPEFENEISLSQSKEYKKKYKKKLYYNRF